MTPTRLPSPADAADARVLADAVAEYDGVAALSEATLLNLEGGSAQHVLRRDAHDRLVGYAQVHPDGVAELCVAPDMRRRGLGSALLEKASRAGARALWAHGNLPAAQGFAARHDLAVVRELHRMVRDLSPEDGHDPHLPDDVEVTSFADDPDLSALAALNAAAFAGHPEQGRLTVEDLRARMAQPWFDPEGLIVLRDRTLVDRPWAAFHWTKAEAPVAVLGGEVYVVGVHPAYQGRGLGRPLTALGTAYLTRLGARSVHLYVDGDNHAALRTYARLGFGIERTDVLLALPARA